MGGDWNDWLGSPNSALLRMCTTLHLVEPWSIYNPHDTDFATHEQGRHRIDSVFVSPEIQHTIKNIRYTPGGLLCSTDHRAILVDFHTSMLFGNIMPAPQNHISRSIRSNDRTAVTIFIDNMYNHLSQHNAFQQSQRLDDGENGTDELVEHIDWLVGEAGNLGEKRCGRRRAVWYSTTLAATRYTVSVLRHFVKGLRVNSDRRHVVCERLQRIQVHIDLPTTLEAAQQLLSKYEDKLADEIQNAESQRRSELSASADTATHQGKLSKATIIRSINKCEKNLHTWKTLKFMSNKEKSQKLDRLDIPRSWPDASIPVDAKVTLEDPKLTQEWMTVTDPAAIEHYLLLRNYQHFGQAYGTPFTVPPLCDDLNWSGTSPASDEILHGTYQNPDICSALCHSLLQQCAASTPINSVPAPITHQEFQGKMKVWKERTTTSPSGRHLGRYKALYGAGTHESGSPEETAFKERQKSIEKVILRILNYCIRTGYPLRRWRQIINTLIFKDYGNYQVHRLRVIHIFEADLNLLYATKWRQLIRHADDQRCIHPGQYGGRPGYEATSLALLEELCLDVSYMTRRTMLTFDNDAASCYDRIVINLASLVNRKYGLHQELTQLHGCILQSTEYKLRTAAGISMTSYMNSSERPLYGTGQGAGNSPGIWLLISSMLFDTFTQTANGAYFTSPDESVQVRMGITGFVDDTNVVINNFLPQQEPIHGDTIEKLRHDAQLWTHLLYLSGGKLELTKCSYHSLQFQFQADGTPKVIQQSNSPDLEIQDPSSNNSIVAVKFLPSTTAHKILGHWKAAADPRQSKQMEILTKMTQQVSLLIAVSPLSRSGARLAYKGKYLAALRYVLPQCWFPRSILVTAEKKSMHRIISKCGFARTTPTALIFAPYEYAGADFVHWHTIQGTGQVKHFIKHWRTDTYESKMLRICVSWAQWQAGLGKSILTDVSTLLPHLESRWLSSLRSFLSQAQCHIELDNTFVPPRERSNDIHIMDFAIQSGEFTDQELRTFNYCRLYLHVTTISELFTANGTHLLRHMFECERPPWFNKENPVILQQRPSWFQRRYQWQRFCRLICRDDLSAGDAINLGHWCWNNSIRLRREAYVQQSAGESYFVWQCNQYWSATRHPKFNQQLELHQPTTWVPNSSCTPVDIIHWNSPRRCTVAPTRLPKLIPRKPVAVPEDFAGYVMLLPHWEQELLQHINWILEPFEIMHYLHKQGSSEDFRLLIVSDGSSIDTTAMSFGLVIGSSSNQILLEAMGPAWGQPSSHRAECTGCLAGALIIQHLSKFTMQQFPENLQFKILSDNQGMIKSLTQRRTYSHPYPNSTLNPDWELLEEIHHTYQSVTTTGLSFEWIRGHQDRTTLASLSVEAKFNIRADHLAGDYCVMVEARVRPQSPIMTQTKCVLYLQEKALHGHYESALRRSVAEPEFFQYLQKRHGWSSTTTTLIDWELFRKAARNFPSTDIHLLKLIHDKLPTNYVKARYQNWTQPHCHFCSEPETFEHLCLSDCNPRSQAFRAKLKSRVAEYFATTNTPRTFSNTFMQAMAIWMSKSSTTICSQWQGPASLFHAQHNIGWKQMIRGFWSNKWRSYLTRCCREATSQTWCDHNNSADCDHLDDDPVECDTFVVSFAAPVHEGPSPAMRDSSIFLPNVLKLIWTELGNMWRSHVDFIHQAGPTGIDTKHVDLCNHIRQLHKFKGRTLAAHQDRYFFPDVETYLQKASTLQMQQYILQYRPVILNSIRHATKIATQAMTIPRFPGFTVITNSTRTIHVSQEEAQHRKHTRLRQLTPSRITNYFMMKPKAPSPTTIDNT